MLEKKSFTRDQILKVVEILGLDANTVQEIYITLDCVTFTEKRWVSVSREEKIEDEPPLAKPLDRPPTYEDPF